MADGMANSNFLFSSPLYPSFSKVILLHTVLSTLYQALIEGDFQLKFPKT